MMAYWIGRIALKSGEVVTEHELRADQNKFDGPPPVVDDLIEVECRGRRFVAKVVSGNWPGRTHPENEIVRLRVSELGLDPTVRLRVPYPRWSEKDQRFHRVLPDADAK